MSATKAGQADRDNSVPFATWDRDGHQVMKAQGEGILVLDNGCIYSEDQRTGRRVALIFPSQTKWDPDAKTLTLDGKTLRIAHRAVYGGGYAHASAAEHIPSSCRYDKNRASLWQVGEF